MASVILVALIVVLWFPGWLLFGRLRSVPVPARSSVGGTRTSTTAVSVVIPARNEAHSLPWLLQSLSHQTVPPREVIVADDGSTDGTGAVAAGHGALVLPVPERPAGWTGKNWACWNAALAASGEMLLFLDADVRLEPHALASIVQAWESRGGMVSIQPYHEMRRFWERLSAFFNIVVLASLDSFSWIGGSPPSGAYGPCLAVGRRDYRLAGGHESVRGHVLEDVALARRFAQAEYPITNYVGAGVVSFRMYPGGIRQLFEGWSKNMAGGALMTRPATLVFLALWLSGVAGAASRLPASVATVPVHQLAWWLSLAAYGLYVAQLSWVLSRIGNFTFLTALLFPVPFVVFVGVFCISAFQLVILRRVRWKGRSIDVGERRRR